MPALMIVHVDERKLGACDLLTRHFQHRDRIVVLERHGRLGLRWSLALGMDGQGGDGASEEKRESVVETVTSFHGERLLPETTPKRGCVKRTPGRRCDPRGS